MIFSGNKLNHDSRKRKAYIQDESDEDVSNESKNSELEDSSDEDTEGLWTCEVDGIKVLFKKLNGDNLQ